MATKYKLMTEYVKDTARKVVRNEAEWKRYLQSAARLYKYPFQEQLLIYAQRPDATACAGIEIWNGKMNCWVNKGAKGIALLDEDAKTPRLKYVFDVKDVHKARHIGRDPYLWEMREEHQAAVLERLENIYGSTNDKDSFEARVLEIAGRIVLDCYEELAEDLAYLVQDSYLEGLDGYTLKIRFREALGSSIGFTLLSRCGAEVEDYGDSFNFDYIHEFSTVQAVALLGSATADLCKPILMEIGKAIRIYDREIPVKISDKSIANTPDINYNALMHESVNGVTPENADVDAGATKNETLNAPHERSKEHGDDISEERRLLNPGYPDRETARGDTDKIRDDAEGLSQGEQERDVFGTPPIQQANEPSVGNAGDDRRKNGSNREPNGAKRRDHRGTKSPGFDAVGTEDEPNQTFGGGTRSNGIDSHVRGLQLNNGQEESDSHGLPDFLPEDLIHGVICNDKYLKNKRPDIAVKFMAEPDANNRAAYIKESYNREYTEFDIGMHRVGYKAVEDGLVMWAGNYLTRSAESKFSWDVIQELIGGYIQKNGYLVLGEQTKGQEMPDNYQQLSLFPSIEEQIGNIAADNADTKFALSAAFLVTDEMVDKVLLSGGGQRDSRARIFAKYQKGSSDEAMTAFLKKEYDMGGKGFTFDNKPVSVWYDEDGMKFADGNAARYTPMRTLTWEEVEEHTHNLILAGQYMDAAEMWQVPVQEKAELASKIYFFLRDEYGTMPEALELSYIYPDSKAKIVEYLSGTAGIEKVLHIMDQAISEIEKGEVKPGIRLIYKPNDIREATAEQIKDPIQFPPAETIEIPSEAFITQDEIDHNLSGGSNISKSTYRIYDLFLHESDITVQKNFLKNEYGTGGRTSALAGSWHSYEDHDAKGLRLSKGSICEPTAEILLTWKKVAERIRKLVYIDRYLSPKEKEKYFEWKTEKERESMETTKREMGIDVERIANESGEEADWQQNQDISGELQEPPEKPDAAETFLKRQEPGETDDRSQAVNFQITDDDLGVGGVKEKCAKNVMAIHTLQLIESEKRNATPDEQRLLSQYVGWGGLAGAFDPQNSSWTSEHAELKSLLSNSEYASARESTLNAHYTPPIIIRSIYETLDKMGFDGGNILEPAMGTGNFFGMLPEKMWNSRLYGAELDSLTGRIARHLYPKATIQVTGFEKTDYPNDLFDAVVGNVPFGQYKVADKPYDKYNFLVHDYFIAKSLDKVRAGGIVAVITSKGTMDKKNPAVRKHLAQRAELLGAVRLPNTAFKDNAGTEVTSDILFFKKRSRVMDIEPEWVHLAANEDNIVINQYFVEYPEMIVGKMEMVSGQFGMEAACSPNEGMPFAVQLKNAISQIHGEAGRVDFGELEDEMEQNSIAAIPASPDVKNYSFTMVEGQVYYRENSVMNLADMSDSMLERIKGMIGIRDCTNDLITCQLEEYGDASIKGKQSELNRLYDNFHKDFGLINSKTNKWAFNQDASYYLLCSLEVLGEDGSLKRKADMFTRRTIKKQEVVTSVDTSSEALAVSMSEKAKVDLAYMSALRGQPQEVIIKDLAGVIFQNPVTQKWENADEYLSGNVREKLQTAKLYAEKRPQYAVNVTALERVQPKLLVASEIEIRLGATWVELGYTNDFMHDIFETPQGKINQNIIGVQYSKVTGQWNIKGKSSDYGNILVEMTYGTSRVNAYKILEDCLNLKDTRIFDTVIEEGKEKRVLNKKETMLASQKQEAIRESYKDWIFRDGNRRETLCATYNELFNSSRPREYDGSHLKFPGMSPVIQLDPHQKNAVAHVLYGNNVLLAHCVGAGYVKRIDM